MGRTTKSAAFLFLGLVFVTIPHGSSASAPVKRILMLFAFESNMPGFISYDTSLRSTLTVSKDYQFEFYVECMDLSRFPGEQYHDKLMAAYREKYSDLKIDLIVVVLRSALDFVAKHSPESFQKVPVILVEQDPTFFGDLASTSLAAVVTGRFDIAGTLALALRLHPHARKIFVVTGASRFDELIRGWARETLRGFESQVEVQYLSGLPMDELIPRVAKLPEQSLVFYLSVTRDGSGKTFRSPDALALISRQSNTPIYSIAETHIDSGMVGGHLFSYSDLGARTAQAVLRALAGEKPGDVEPSEGSVNRYIFDARELRRWGIGEENLPPGSEVRYREFSAWREYRWQIVGVLSIIFIQVLFISGLVISRRKQRRADRALRRAESKYRTVANYTYDWEYWTAPDGTMNYVSPSCKRTTGYTPQEFIDNPSLRYEIIIPEDRQIWDRHKADAGPELESREIQFRILTHDGEIRWIDHGCRPVTDQNGEFQGTRASNRDVTEKKMAEARAQQHRDELSHVTRVAALGELTSSLAHELNQPLAAILNYASAAQRFLAGAEPNLGRVSEALQGIIRDGKRAAEVIRRVRALLRKQKPHYSSLDMNNVIGESLDLFRGDSILKGLSIVTELAPELPAVQGDRVQLQQVLINLTMNAAAAMSCNMLDSLRLVFRTEVSEDQSVKVSVRDFGAGINEDQKDRLFEPFYTTKPEGFGMGLAICHNIIDAHGGRIWAENNPDGGATFCFTLQAAGGSVERTSK
ncbi:MAG: ATP-binding protein [Syntrophobacteraceae bacterium]